jgi:CheY-like chemotaxis protein
VDDERPLAEAFAGVLRRAGYEAEAETDPVQAFHRAQRLRPDLMVIDWKMSGSTYDGLELLFNVRKDPQLRSVPVILLVWGCAWYSHQEFFQATSFPPDDYLDKPFTPKDLLDRVRRLLPLPETG